jgi:hypothetical protein
MRKASSNILYLMDNMRDIDEIFWVLIVELVIQIYIGATIAQKHIHMHTYKLIQLKLAKFK